MELVHFKFNCRICLKSRKPFKNVYCHVVDGFQDPLVQMVFALFNVQFETHQAYPQFMCKRCLNRLTHILLFKQEVLRNQETLFDLFKTSHSSYVQQNNRNDFELKLESLDDQIVIKSEPLTPPKLATTDAVEDSLRYSSSFFSTQLIEKRHSSNERRSTQIENENLFRNIPRSSCIAESRNARACKTKRKENIRQILTKIRRTNKCNKKIEVKNASDFGDPSNNNVYLQAAFLQNFNLITLQQAQMLQNLKQQSNKTRLKGALLQNSINVIKSHCRRKNHIEKSHINLRSKQMKTRNSFMGLPVNKSDSFPSKPRHRKKIDDHLQPGKGFIQPTEDRRILAMLDPDDSLSGDKTDAISKKIGCETEEDVKYKQHRVKNIEFSLEQKRSNCTIKKAKLDSDKIRNILKLSSAKRLDSEIAGSVDFQFDLPSKEAHRIVSHDSTVYVKDSCAQLKSRAPIKKQFSTVLRKLRSSGSTEDITGCETEQKIIAKKLRSSSNKMKSSTCSTLSSCSGCSLKPFSKTSNWKSKADNGFANSRNNKLPNKNGKLNVLNNRLKLESRKSIVSKGIAGALVKNSTIENNKTNTSPHKTNNLISKTRSTTSTLLYMGLKNKTFCADEGVKPIVKLDDALTCNSSQKVITGQMQCRKTRNQIVKQFYTKAAKCERKSPILQNVEDDLDFRINAKCASKTKKRRSIEYISPTFSNELMHYPPDSKARIVNIGDDSELQLSLISADSLSSFPTGLLSQTVSYMGSTIDSKTDIVKLEPEESLDLTS